MQARRANLFYGQSGGVTSVINATAQGVIETALQHRNRINKVLCGHNGILGLINEELFDLTSQRKDVLQQLHKLPGGFFGSCRYKLPDFRKDRRIYQRIVDVLDAHNIHYFLYNGGNDSAITTLNIAQIRHEFDYPITCISIPKTIDNDLPFTDSCPGYASTAKYIATATREAGIDLAAMETSIQVYIMTVMGRNSGWIAGASGLAQQNSADAPHIILFPEIPFDTKLFLAKVSSCVKKHGHCLIVTANNIRTKSGRHIATKTERDAFGHYHYLETGPTLSNLITKKLGLICHYANPSFLQRCARHLASKVDIEQAYALGKSAVEFCLADKHNKTPIIIRNSGTKFHWHIGETAISNIANKERMVPRSFISKDGFGITQKFRDYLSPLIQGEDIIEFENGLPKYPNLKKHLILKKLKPIKGGYK